MHICPICEIKPNKKNIFVRYHVRYRPEICIMACKYCNYGEKYLRGKVDSIGPFIFKRLNKIRNYHLKLGIPIKEP